MASATGHASMSSFHGCRIAITSDRPLLESHDCTRISARIGTQVRAARGDLRLRRRARRLESAASLPQAFDDPARWSSSSRGLHEQWNQRQDAGGRGPKPWRALSRSFRPRPRLIRAYRERWDEMLKDALTTAWRRGRAPASRPSAVRADQLVGRDLPVAPTASGSSTGSMASWCPGGRPDQAGHAGCTSGCWSATRSSRPTRCSSTTISPTSRPRLRSACMGSTSGQRPSCATSWRPSVSPCDGDGLRARASRVARPAGFARQPHLRVEALFVRWGARAWPAISR